MLLSAMGAGKGGERKKGRESARKPGKTNAVRRKRGESHDFSAIALPGCARGRTRWYNASRPEYPAFQGYPEYLAEDVSP